MKSAVYDLMSSVVDLFASLPGKIIDSILSIPAQIRQSIPDIQGAASEVWKTIKENVGVNLPGKAGGGDVTAGEPYLVGEKGPEIFRPSSSGSITPNNQIGGSINIASIVGSMTFNVNGGREAAAEVESAVMSALDKIGRMDLRAQLGMSLS
jgi:hypothetical protein